MEELSALWRVRGRLAVPVWSDDHGLVSRIADVFTGTDHDVVEERDDYLRFSPPTYFLQLPIRGVEIWREGVKGWRHIRYDLPVLHILPSVLFHGLVLGALFGQALVWAGVPPYAYLAPLLAMLFLYGMAYRGARSSANAMLRRAFEV
jgi:hypothetical protein